MSTTPVSRIMVIAETGTPEWANAIEGVGFAVQSQGFQRIDPTEVARAHAVIIEVSPKTLNSAQALCRRWRIELGEQYVPIIWIITDGIPLTAGLDAGADTVIREPLMIDHLLAQLKASLRVQHLHARLASRAGESQQLNQRLLQAYQQIDGDLELTRRIHRGFMPRTLPEVGQARFAVCYRPRSRIGGDFYDVMRLDEEHICAYVADAMGRGLPASSLLSIFVKKSMVSKEILGRSYRLVPPGEVLDRLNRELVNLSLPEPPFVTMCYMQLNCRDGNLTFARAAHPHPLYIPNDADPEYWHSAGTLLGVFEAEYPVQQRQLRLGDKVLIYSDGVHPPTTNIGGPNDLLIESVKKHRHLAVQPFVDQVARDLLDDSHHPEDFTLLCLEYK